MSQQEVYYLLLNILAILYIIRIISSLINSWKQNRSEKKQRNKVTIIKKPKPAPKKWSPTGWYWDEDKQKWVPPDYLSEESARRWKWDENKRIWIDQDKKK